MLAEKSAASAQPGVPVTANLRWAFILVTSLFFMWGLSYGLLDVLNKHFQETLHVTKAQSGLLQAAYFGAYFLVALPAGYFMDRKGYKAGILVGLCLYALGALLFVPAASANSFGVFLFALFVIASGLGCLETAANPYATVLGDAQGAERRLNLAQSFNGLGQFIGPLIGGTWAAAAGHRAQCAQRNGRHHRRRRFFLYPRGRYGKRFQTWQYAVNAAARALPAPMRRLENAMPHFYAECTDNIRREADLPTLFAKVNEALAATGIFPLAGVRSRAIWLDTWQMADGKQDYAFVHMTLKIGHGRSLESRQQVGEMLFALIKEHFAALMAQRYLALSFTMEELDPVLNYKQNNVHALFNKA